MRTGCHHSGVNVSLGSAYGRGHNPGGISIDGVQIGHHKTGRNGAVNIYFNEEFDIDLKSLQEVVDKLKEIYP